MKVYIITGTSSGIGKALAQFFSNQPNSVVYGIARREVSINDSYHHQKLDLTQPGFLSDVQWPKLTQEDELILINNAGFLGDVKPIGEADAVALSKVIELNVTVPLLLINETMALYTDGSIKTTVVNISSGAGKNAIHGWAAYCASKAAVDLMSETIHLEQIENKNFKIYAIAPGVVDTEMQGQIRAAEEGDFPRVDYFRDLKSNNELAAPTDVAKKINHILNHPELFTNVVCSVREVE